MTKQNKKLLDNKNLILLENKNLMK